MTAVGTVCHLTGYLLEAFQPWDFLPNPRASKPSVTFADIHFEGPGNPSEGPGKIVAVIVVAPSEVH
eukprot:6468563-Amphidinium_carterae.2